MRNLFDPNSKYLSGKIVYQRRYSEKLVYLLLMLLHLFNVNLHFAYTLMNL